MEIYVQKDEAQQGPYTLDEIRARIENGALLPDDWGWNSKLSDWVRLRTFLGNAATAAPETIDNRNSLGPITHVTDGFHAIKPNQNKNWKSDLVGWSALLGFFLICFGLWVSCEAKESWSPREQGSYEHYKATENAMVVVVLLGLILAAPALFKSCLEKKDELSLEMKKAKEFDRKVHQNPDLCPNCGSTDYDTYHPSKPRVWTPLNITGVILGAAANSMADAIFKPERVCTHCGCRWPVQG